MRLAQMMIAFALVAIGGAARADQYPSRPITLVVPFAAGGSNDTIARVIGERLSKAWGRPVIVENQSGAGGSLAAARVAKATPDGYTLLITSPNFTINAVVQRELPFDPATAFTAVALLARSPMVLVTAPQRGFKSAAELLAFARANPGKLSYASSGTGSINYIAGELLKIHAALQIAHVPYRGVAPALNDVIGGHVDLLIAGVPAVIEQIRAGKIAGLAVTSKQPTAFAPDLPTLDQTIARGYELEQWWGILAPAQTPSDVVEKLNAEINRALASAEVREILAREGARETPGPPDALARLIAEEIPRWRALAAQGHLRAE